MYKKGVGNEGGKLLLVEPKFWEATVSKKILNSGSIVSYLSTEKGEKDEMKDLGNALFWYAIKGA